MQFRHWNRKEHPNFFRGPPWLTFTTLKPSSRDQRSEKPSSSEMQPESCLKVSLPEGRHRVGILEADFVYG